MTGTPKHTTANPMTVLSLFSGIGGLDLGLERAGMQVVGQVERDPFCRQVLAHHWPEVPQHDDVRTAVEWWRGAARPRVDVVAGGFPCQDISGAGRRAGIIEGERSSLWTYLAHTVRELRPDYVLVENVAAILGRGLDVVAGDLAEVGYDLRWDCVPAAAVGAPHLRDRWFGVAYPHRDPVRVEPVTEPGREGPGVAAVDGSARDLADATSERRGQGRPRRPSREGPDWARVWPQALADTDCVAGKPRGDLAGGGTHRCPGSLGRAWAAEPDVGRVVDGPASRLDRRRDAARLRALGNAVVPQVAEHVGRLIVAHAAQEVAA